MFRFGRSPTTNEVFGGRRKDSHTLGDSIPNNIRLGAIQALGSIDADPARNFQTVGSLVSEPSLRRAATNVLLNIPREHRDESTATQLAAFLVDHAEKTPAPDRTSEEFIEAMQLADQVLGLVAKDKSDSYRKRLGEVTIRVVLIHTVEEEMRYDIRWFAVEAGRDVPVILKNEDLMAHNLVITKPEATEGSSLPGKNGRQSNQQPSVRGKRLGPCRNFRMSPIVRT